MSQPPAGTARSLHLHGPFRARRGGMLIRVPAGGARVLAYLALHSTASRSEVAGTLWPDVPQRRANSDLRTALWRLHAVGADFIDPSSGPVLSLVDGVVVDVRQVIGWATQVLRAPTGRAEVAAPPPGAERDLLPGWNDPWLEPHRERVRLLTIQAFESVAERLLTAGHPAQALPYLLHVTQADPLRESAQQLLLELYLDQRNVHEALRLYRRYRSLVRREMGIEPGAGIRTLVSRYLPRTAAE